MPGSIIELRWNVGQSGLTIDVYDESDTLVEAALTLTEQTNSKGYYRAAALTTAVSTTGLYRVLIKNGSTVYDTQYVYLYDSDSSTVRYAEESRELAYLTAQTFGGGDATEAKQDAIITHLTDVKGTGFAKDTHSLPQCLTATGFSTHDAAAVVTAMQAVAGDFKADVTNLDVAVSTRLAAAGYTAPDNAGITANGAAVAALNDLSTADIDARLAAYDGPTKAEMDSAFTEIKGATFSAATDTLEAIRDRGDAAWTTATGFSTLDAAGVRTAVGLSVANLDTQLGDIPTAAANADAVRDLDIDGQTLQAALRIIAAICAGKVSGAGTATEVFKGLDGATTRATVTADASGNRSAVTYG